MEFNKLRLKKQNRFPSQRTAPPARRAARRLPLTLAATLMLWNFSPLPAHAVDRPGNIDADGTTITDTLSNDTRLTGNALARNSGELRLSVYDTSGISGNITADSNGIIYLTTYDNALITGNIEMDNGGDLEIALNGSSQVTGTITVSNSGGVMNLAVNDNASITGHIYGGSSSHSNITVSGSGSILGGIEARSGGTIDLTTGGNAVISGGLSSTSGSSKLNVISYGDTVFNGGLEAYGSGEADLRLFDNTVFNGDLNITGSGILTYRSVGNAKVNGNLTTAGGSNSHMAFYGSSSMTGNVTNSATTNIELHGNSRLTGNSDTTGGANTTFSLSDNATWTGASSNAWGTINVTLDGAGTTWNVTQAPKSSSGNGATGTQYASHVDNLVLNGGWVNLGAQDYSNYGPTRRVQLDIHTLSGQGNFDLRPYVNGISTAATNTGDLIYVTNTSGSHSLNINSAALGLGGAAVMGDERLMLVRSIDGGGNFYLYQELTVEIGPYEYRLSQIGTDWYLVGVGFLDPGFGVNPGGGIIGGGGGSGSGGYNPPKLNNVAKVTTSFITSSYMINNVEMETLLQRLGDLRHTRKGDVWARTFFGNSSQDDFKQLSGYKMDYFGFQMGADMALKEVSDNLFVGLMLGYTGGSPKHNGSHVDLHSYNAGLYALWGTEDDFYIDTTFKVSHIKNEFDIKNSQGVYVSGDGSTNIFSFGVEVGQRFYLAEEREGWYVEPQLQSTYSRLGEFNSVGSNGLRTNIKAADSLLLRGSVLVGYNIKTDPFPLNVYAKGGYIREFLGDVDAHYNNLYHDSYDFEGNMWDWGLGVTAELSDRHSLYLDLGYTGGDQFDKKQVNLGYRFAF